MSKKQSRRDFWRWWREQEEIEKSIKVWPYAGEWFWQAPHRMSGRANTRHEAMGAAKAALRKRREFGNQAVNDIARYRRACGTTPKNAAYSGSAPSGAVDAATGLVSTVTRTDVIQAMQSYGFALKYSADKIGAQALAMGRAAGAAARMGATMEAVSDE